MRVVLSTQWCKCRYTLLVARHRFNLREQCFLLPRRVSYSGDGDIAESEASLHSAGSRLARYVVQASCDTARRHYWPSVGTSSGPNSSSKTVILARPLVLLVQPRHLRLEQKKDDSAWPVNVRSKLLSAASGWLKGINGASWYLS